MTGSLRKPYKCLFDSQKPQRGFAEETGGFSRRSGVGRHIQPYRGCALKVEGLGLSVERQFSLNTPHSTDAQHL